MTKVHALIQAMQQPAISRGVRAASFAGKCPDTCHVEQEADSYLKSQQRCKKGGYEHWCPQQLV